MIALDGKVLKGAWEELPDVKGEAVRPWCTARASSPGSVYAGAEPRGYRQFAGSSSQRHIGRVHPGDPTPEEIHAVRWPRGAWA